MLLRNFLLSTCTVFQYCLHTHRFYLDHFYWAEVFCINFLTQVHLLFTQMLFSYNFLGSELHYMVSVKINPEWVDKYLSDFLPGRHQETGGISLCYNVGLEIHWVFSSWISTKTMTKSLRVTSKALKTVRLMYETNEGTF